MQPRIEGAVTSRVKVFARHTWARLTGEWRGKGGRAIPAFRPGARVANWLAMRRDVLGLLARAMREHGDVVRIPAMYNDVHLVNDAEVLREILVAAPASYGRGISHALLRGIVGDGLLTAEFEEWVGLRRAAAPSFSTAGLRDIEATAAGSIAAWMARWEGHARRGETRPLALDMMTLATQISAAHFFAAELRVEEAAQFVDDFLRVQVLTFRRVTAPWAIDPAAGRALARIRRLAARLVAVGPHAELHAQAMTVLAAAPENPSNTLAWTLYLLGRHPQIGRRAAEAAAAGDDSYLAAVVHESLRLYPGAWSFDRTALEDRVVAGYHFPAGTLLLASPYTLHRCPRRWPEPEVFRPERFLDRPARALDVTTYMPFGAGPRRCIGDRFALAVVMAVLRRFLVRFRVELDPRERGAMWPMFTLRPRTNVLARLVPLS